MALGSELEAPGTEHNDLSGTWEFFTQVALAPRHMGKHEEGGSNSWYPGRYKVSGTDHEAPLEVSGRWHSL